MPIKLHRPLLEAIELGLKDIFSGGKYADDVVRHLLSSSSRWGSRDRKFVAETIYNIVRWWRKYAYAAGYKYDELSKVSLPDIIAIELLRPAEEIINREQLDADWEKRDEWLKSLNEPMPLEVETSFPDWFHELAQKELGERWPETARALNDPADVYLRTNTLKTTRDKLLSKLKKEGTDAEADERAREAIRLLSRVNLSVHPIFRQGEFEIQDIASQQVAHICEPKENMLIVDACAGAGGKTLHLAALAKNKSRIIASDIFPKRLQKLRERSKQAGAKIEIVHPDELNAFKGKCDLVLLDVPCSGTGVIRRNPDTKWKLTAEKLELYKQQQAEILEKHSALVKAGGKLVYATCSILPSEDEEQLKFFLEKQPEFKLQEEKRSWPQEGWDGFYVGVMKIVR